jgi:DNA repair exonuclease SbcCD ATPase subunit
MARAKKAQVDEKQEKPEDKKETEEQLKKKVDSLVEIIEELSSNVDKSGLPEVENLIDTKLKEMNEKFELKFQDLKTSLDSIDKKAGRSKTKEEISALIEEFKKSLEPRFATLEDRLKLLDRLENISEPAQDQSQQNPNSTQLAVNQPSIPLKQASNYEIEMIKRNINEINQSLSGLKEQMDIIRNGVRAQGLLDASDIQKLEHVLASLDEMIPQKSVIDNFRVAFREINDLKSKMNEFRQDLQRYAEKQKENYDDISSRIETLVKYLNALMEERDRSFDEISKLATDTFTKAVNIEKSLDYLSRSVKELREMAAMQGEKMKVMDDMSRRLNSLSSKDDVKFVNEGIKKMAEASKKEMDEMIKVIEKMRYSLDSRLAEEVKSTKERFDKIERAIDEGLRRNNELIKTMVEEKKGLEKAIEVRKQKIVNILKELRR